MIRFLNNDVVGLIMAFGLVFIFAGIYLLPCLIAMTRNTKNRSYVAIINAFFGWTVILWLVALVMATEGEKK